LPSDDAAEGREEGFVGSGVVEFEGKDACAGEGTGGEADEAFGPRSGPGFRGLRCGIEEEDGDRLADGGGRWLVDARKEPCFPPLAGEAKDLGLAAARVAVDAEKTVGGLLGEEEFLLGGFALVAVVEIGGAEEGFVVEGVVSRGVPDAGGGTTIDYGEVMEDGGQWSGEWAVGGD
jgi:hypothetical protein